MQARTRTAATLAALTIAAPALQASPQEVPGALFAPPVPIQAGDAPAGQKRLYPSPALQDLNGDGRPDLVVGDLPGRVTVALATDDGFGPEEDLLRSDGNELRFENW